MFDTILIANRGEIACRVIRTARRMGIRTVAVHSDADAQAMHVAMADTAVRIGPAPARESYLSIPAIIEACRRTGAQAVHPGYGFLSENAEFAQACADAGVAFIGPPPAAIRAMGSKSAAKQAMEAAGVPLVPGYHGADQDPARLAEHAAAIGYPVLIKASAGGGGKGMRIVTAPGEFAEALELARGEARSAFGDDQVLIERYLTRPRHIEIQVMADGTGQAMSLYERDCSIQRRHQKVVEEAPAPFMTEARRAAMGQAACDAARAIGYVGAGTVEFIVDADGGAGEGADDAFFFMEMNTRLQVEHPVTEAITGQDLVEWQLRIAAGGTLPPQPPLRGHAIEVRVYAEDPARNFMPSIGRIAHLREPAASTAVRIDTGVRAGDAISVHYDPMIAKLIVHGPDRDAAVRLLRQALSEYEVAGVQTNLALLRRIAAHPAFAAAELDTGFIARHEAALLPPAEPAPPAALAAAAAHLAGRPAAAAAADPHSPWSAPGAWRMNGAGHLDVALRDGAGEHVLRATWPAGRLTLSWDGHEAVAEGGAVTLGGVRHAARVVAEGPSLTVFLDGAAHALGELDPTAPPDAAVQGDARVTAPMPGRIVSIAAAAGQAVKRGDVLLVLEAMKVQMRLAAPRDGVVAAVHAAEGDLVEDGTELVSFEA
jgi:3-methylcrotonyl-CoA carboxylase alpha subunit